MSKKAAISKMSEGTLFAYTKSMSTFVTDALAEFAAAELALDRERVRRFYEDAATEADMAAVEVALSKIQLMDCQAKARALEAYGINPSTSAADYFFDSYVEELTFLRDYGLVYQGLDGRGERTDRDAARERLRKLRA